MRPGSAGVPARGRGGIAAVVRRGTFALAAVLAFAGATLPAFAAQAQDGAGPRGEPQSKSLRDPDFGVTTRHPGLQRHVEMYQWTRDGAGYALEWRGARVDSSGFAPGHANPRDIPLREREWRADVTLDGKPVARDVVDALGHWQPFRPNFSALPGNMAATFQPEGDGLGSAENPLEPQVGDLRITWRALVLPPLADRLLLRDGAWALREPVETPPAVDAATATPAPDDTGRDRPRWPFVVVPILVVLVGLAIAMRRRRGQRA
ncbi:MAG TPA: TMEM43 family protein [Luteimonas sp.]|nr:TMEM43 family protein [Luteimonas sp.]